MRPCTTHHHACDCREAKFAALEAENATLRNQLLADHDVLAEYAGKDGHRDWQSGSAWLYPGDKIVVVRAP